MSANIGLAIAAFAIGIVAWIVLGNPLWLLVAAIVGAVAANRTRRT